MSKILAVLISFAVIASSFASAAQAGPGRRMGMFFGGMAAMSMMAHAAEQRRRQEAYERMRARQMMAARERERRRAIAAAAAKREQARQLALKKQKAAEIAAAEQAAEAQNASTGDDQPALKKGDRLPSAEETPSAVADSTKKTTTIEKVSTDKIETSSTTSAEPAVSLTCRRYSVATDSVIETPCQ